MPGKQFRDPSLLKRPWIKSLFVEVATGSDVSRLTPEEFRLEVTNGPGRVLHCQVLTVVPDEGRVLLFDGQHTMWAKLSEECKNTMDPDTLGYRFETLAGKIVIPKKFWFCIRISGSDNDLQLMIERLLVWGSDVLVEMEAPSPIEEDPEIRDILGGLGLTKLVRGTATVLAPLQALENRFRGKIDNYWTERYHRTMGIGTAKTDEPFHSADQNPSFDGNRAALELVAMSSSGSEQNGDVTEDNGEPIDVEDLESENPELEAQYTLGRPVVENERQAQNDEAAKTKVAENFRQEIEEKYVKASQMASSAAPLSTERHQREPPGATQRKEAENDRIETRNTQVSGAGIQKSQILRESSDSSGVATRSADLKRDEGPPGGSPMREITVRFQSRGELSEHFGPAQDLLAPEAVSQLAFGNATEGLHLTRASSAGAVVSANILGTQESSTDIEDGLKVRDEELYPDAIALTQQECAGITMNRLEKSSRENGGRQAAYQGLEHSETRELSKQTRATQYALQQRENGPTEQTGLGEQTGRSEGTEQTERTERTEQTERTEHTQQAEETEHTQQAEETEHTRQAEETEHTQQAEPTEHAQQTDQSEQTESLHQITDKVEPENQAAAGDLEGRRGHKLIKGILDEPSQGVNRSTQKSRNLDETGNRKLDAVREGESGDSREGVHVQIPSSSELAARFAQKGAGLTKEDSKSDIDVDSQPIASGKSRRKTLQELRPFSSIVRRRSKLARDARTSASKAGWSRVMKSESKQQKRSRPLSSSNSSKEENRRKQMKGCNLQ
eukprot:CAMPEP_0113963156 /NCGR_PEP_ID=MMETSP0011_2-20120614/6344_1 /TAXON_ID=101924 /ORGANISM="Rhodosorus marinus" /LENGTH=788 /DNA_ID=CAMNT_0000975149 /DNA_START=264 /DNA_END=2630 /DNA_ORIENTATION=- /assembly_acc=CAM_ASM_000156